MKPREAIMLSVELGRPVTLRGGTDDGNARYDQCTDLADNVSGTSTTYNGTALDGRKWCVHLLRAGEAPGAEGRGGRGTSL